MALEKGIYEQVVNDEVKSDISSLSGLKATTERMDGDYSSILISKYIESVVRKVIEDKENVEDKVEVANEIIRHLASSFKDYGFDSKIIDPKGEALTEIRDQRFSSNRLVRPNTSLVTSMLFSGDSEYKLVDELKKEILSSDRVDMLVSFLRVSGIAMIRRELNEFAERGGKLRVVCTTYTGATEPRAVKEISGLPNAEVKISYDTQHTTLHAKAYMFIRNTDFNTAYIGSSNLSKKAITDGREWNVKITSHDQKDVFARMRETFETYWNSEEFEEYREEDYKRLCDAISFEKRKDKDKPMDSYSFDIKPYPFQEAILDKLEVERKILNNYRNLIVAATGTGKTVISAFDYRRFKNENRDNHRLLFVAHREEILRQSLSCFKGVLKDPCFGELYTGNKSDITEGASLFATIQKLDNKENYTRFSPSYFDFIIIDEFHHAASDSYQKVLNYFKPKVLLGLTATPERMDGKDILKYFDGRHIAAEIRLPEAIERQLLVPFHYFCVRDTVDLEGLTWSRGGYEVSELENVYVLQTEVAKKRAGLVLDSIKRYVSEPSEIRCLGFCVSVKHAEFMASFFNDQGCNALSLSSSSSEEERNSAKNRIRNGEINFIFTVDLYNEGVDIPEIDTVMFLRPTESLTVFLQQLGRGLRTSPNKEFLTVLDYIGQSNKKYSFENKFKALLNKKNRGLINEIKNGSMSLPSGCHIEMEKEAMEIILDNIKGFHNTKRKLIEKLRCFEADSDSPISVENFFSYYNMDPRVFYKNGSFVSLMEEAMLIKRERRPIDSHLDSALKNLIFVDSERWMEFLLSMLSSPLRKAENKSEELMLKMFFFTVFNSNAKEFSIYDVLDAIRSDEYYLKEFKELLDYRLKRIEQVSIPMDGEVPLDVYCSYSRNQILSAFNHKDPSNMQEGVYYSREYNTDILLVTLKKTEKLYTPTTMYKNYAINPYKFHWESQNKTTTESESGKRYINSSSNVLLFVRESKVDMYNMTPPHTFLGPVKIESHRGNKPMEIVWKMKYRIPARFIEELTRGLAI